MKSVQFPGRGDVAIEPAAAIVRADFGGWHAGAKLKARDFQGQSGFRSSGIGNRSVNVAFDAFFAASLRPPRIGSGAGCRRKTP
jgi:hypothetical protein